MRIAITIFAAVVPAWLVVAILLKRLLNTFGEGLLVEAFGMLLDVLVIGIIILWLNEKREKQRRIERWQEEIDDFRGWNEKEAMFRIVGNIKRLNRAGKTDIDLSYCFLENAPLGWDPQKFSDFELSNLSLEEKALKKKGYLIRVRDYKPKKTYLKKASFIGGKLRNINLNSVDLKGVNFYWADLQNADMKWADLDGANFQYADLHGIDLRQAKGLTLSQLSETKSLYKAKLDPTLEQQVREKYPYLLKPPENEPATNDKT